MGQGTRVLLRCGLALLSRTGFRAYLKQRGATKAKGQFKMPSRSTPPRVSGPAPETLGSISPHRPSDAVSSNLPDGSPKTMLPTSESDDQRNPGMLDDREELGGVSPVLLRGKGQAEAQLGPTERLLGGRPARLA